ncbi:MAG: RNA polymerase factor sigma-54 [Planctomycetota bacterium]
MKISFGQNLSQKQTQKLAPRMIQSMEILQMGNTALDEKIEQELIENPALERNAEIPEIDDDASSRIEREKEKNKDKDVEQKELIVEEGQGGEDDFERLLNLDNDIPDHFDESTRPSSNRIQEIGDRQHDMISNIVDRGESLQNHLMNQLHELELEPRLKKMCERIVSSLSAKDGGYLKLSLRDLLPPDAGDEGLELAEEALAHVQQLDPAGVAARDLSECLLLQLSPKIKNLKNVRQLILNHLEDLQYNRMPQIQKATGLTIDQIHEAWDELKTLDPRPASRFAVDFVPTVKPDVWLEITEDGEYIVKMEEGPTRNLYISKYYRQRLANGQATKEEKEFIKRKITSAQWLIESIEQRRSTLTRVAQEIVNFQRDFFEFGPENIKPLKMDQVAEKVGVAVTTVSRAVDEKYIDTHRGIYPLRMFFVGGTKTDDGEDIAWNKIRLELQKLIDEEDKSKPYSDEEIMRRLKAKGFNVARRTVTKYREKMDIPSSRRRRDWSKKK